ncbi:TetR family transcriptional regulator [Nocardiopsis sp. SBT366]|uniref:TetR family transcriptional regulator n=1 Tax=Nocardiopsis sp. SBT366 TaxID=1580529 RepID=UPI0009E2E057|nr:TetR family transcriptional regulator [Nocardiopsis sp. SBT366]
MTDEIAAHGIRLVTLARIAACAGLAVGSVRHHFGDTLREVMRFTDMRKGVHLSERPSFVGTAGFEPTTP